MIGPPEQHCIGWKEFIDLPDWNVRKARAKIDTGARTSAVNARVLNVRACETGEVLSLEITLRRKPGTAIVIEAPVVRTTVVKNSSGELQLRYVVETTIQLGPVCKKIEMTVADRSLMLTPIILGRGALLGDFLVDVNRKYIWRV